MRLSVTNLGFTPGGAGEPPIITATLAPAEYSYSDGDTVGDHPDFATLDTTGNYASTAGTISTVEWLVDGTDRASSYVLSAGEAVVVRVTDSAANTRDWTVDASVAAVVPDAFTSGDWSVASGGSTVTITTLPDDGGSALTDIEYRVNSGSAVSLGETTTGTYSITASDGDDVEIRAVNSVGAGAWSDTKTVSSFTPADLFAASEQGIWLDPSDLSTMFQDSAGTTAVTADGDPVGRIEDKSGNGNHATQATSAARPTYRTSGGLHWLEFDGVDDALQTAAIDFTGTDAVSVFAGLERTATTSNESIAELSGAWFSGAGKFAAFLLDSAETRLNMRGDSSASGRNAVVTGPSAGAAAVFNGQGDISADTIEASLNGGTTTTTSIDMGAGNLGNYALNIGARDNGASLNLDGKIFSLIVRGALTTGTDETGAEEHVADKSGVTL